MSNVLLLVLLAAGNNNYTALIIATTVGIPSVAVIVVAILVVIICWRKNKGMNAMNEEPIYDNPECQPSGGVTNTDIALQELPQVKENIAYGTFAPQQTEQASSGVHEE